ncbi:hypothetical protein DFJ74DRAFT_335707 [Hyaloraphidium curvatum]|nr:hypothetical protein DFJ74DRAFT_335707 [Hyaloraphidium curvatum]
MSGEVPPDAPRPVRAHTAVSCQACRTRKTRCGGDGASACPFCMSRGLQCVYPQTRRAQIRHPAVPRAAAAGQGPPAPGWPYAGYGQPAPSYGQPAGYPAYPPYDAAWRDGGWRADGAWNPGQPANAPPHRPPYPPYASPQPPAYPAFPSRPMDSLLAAVHMDPAVANTRWPAPYPQQPQPLPPIQQSLSQQQLAPQQAAGYGYPQTGGDRRPSWGDADANLERRPSWTDRLFEQARPVVAPDAEPSPAETAPSPAAAGMPSPAPALGTPSPANAPSPGNASNSPAPDARRPIADLYPAVAPGILPPLRTVLALADLHLEYRNTFWNFLHFPTLKHRIGLGTADPALLLAVMYSGAHVVELDRRPASSGDIAPFADDDPLDALAATPDEIEAECLRLLRARTEAFAVAAERGEPPEPAAVLDVLQALTFARPVISLKNHVAALVEITLSIDELFPLARLGLLPEDRPGARDPRNLAAWIAAEERCRANAVFLVADVARAASTRTVSRLLPARQGADQPWLDMPAPAPDLVFESLPPSPSTPAEWDEWSRRDRASGGILDPVRPPPLRGAVTWPDLPRGHPERDAVLRAAVGGMLRNGMNAGMPVVNDLWARALVVCEAFRRAGLRVYAPPAGGEVAQARAGLVEAADEFFANLPAEMREFDARQGDKGDWHEVGARWWGKARRFRIAPMLFFSHLILVLLHSPDDCAAQLEHPDPPRGAACAPRTGCCATRRGGSWRGGTCPGRGSCFRRRRRGGWAGGRAARRCLSTARGFGGGGKGTRGTCTGWADERS